MSWTELLKTEMEETYLATRGLMEMVQDDAPGWRPESGENWMTTGQLLQHLPIACGFCCKAFLTGGWGDSTEMMTAETMPAAASVAAALEALDADREVALAAVKEAGEDALATREVAAPWAPKDRYALGRHFLHMVNHLAQHKAQLYYYLKLQGAAVHTGHLWGIMPPE